MIAYQDRCSALDQSTSIHACLFGLPEEFDQKTLFSSLSVNKQGLELSRKDYLERVTATSNFLKSRGVVRGSKVAILSNTRMEWVIADLAILSLGAISVSIYQSLLPSEIAYILHDSSCNYIFIENQEQLEKLEEISAKSWDIPAIEGRSPKVVEIPLNLIVSFETVTSKKFDVPALSEIFSDNLGDRSALDMTVSREDLASIVYTSGTTGPPKGVMQSHGNHLSNVRQVLESGLMLTSGSIFLFLPLAHSFARLMAYISLFSPLALKFPEISDPKSSKVDTSKLSTNLRESNCEIVPVVPRLLEKIKSQIDIQSGKPGVSNQILKATLHIAREHQLRPSFVTQFLNSLTVPIRKKISTRIFGSNFRYCVSGGAKLPTSVHEFFDSLGISVLQGYGLTETCVATNVCRPNQNKIGSVGPVLSKDIEIMIGEDQEIQIRGPNIALGYLNREKATRESWTADGWFLTGDQGYLDEEGFLYITGRKKELIVTSGGKKISPGAIEEKILQHEIFSQVVVFGNDRKFCSAILSLNEDNVCRKLNISKEQLSSQKDKVNEIVEACLAKTNSNLASFESIKKFIISDTEFTQENGLLTPSLKIKRNEVEKRFEAEIEKIYSSLAN